MIQQVCQRLVTNQRAGGAASGHACAKQTVARFPGERFQYVEGVIQVIQDDEEQDQSVGFLLQFESGIHVPLPDANWRVQPVVKSLYSGHPVKVGRGKVDRGDVASMRRKQVRQVAVSATYIQHGSAFDSGAERRKVVLEQGRKQVQ